MSKFKDPFQLDDVMRGQGVTWPTCKTHSNVSLAEEVPFAIPETIPSGTSAARITQPTAKNNKVSIIVALVIGMAVGYSAQTLTGPIHSFKSEADAVPVRTSVVSDAALPSRTANEFNRALPRLSLMTRDEWKGKLKANFPDVVGSNYIQGIPVDKFKARMGAPQQTKTLGDETSWYYNCSDGVIQIVMDAAVLDQYKVVLANINDD